MIDPSEFKKRLMEMTGMQENPFHPFVWIVGNPLIGEGVFIGGFSIINARDANVVIGKGCDIASFVSINCADSHRRCIGISDEIDRRDITIGDHVFVGSHSFIKGGARVGHHSVIAAGTIVGPGEIPAYSLVFGNPMVVKPGYYLNKIKEPR
jgi:acetyltransferase-like isoleucine patch superfamily enzyme